MVLFIGSNPSHLNKNPDIPFVGSKSEKNFNDWAGRLAPNGYSVVNVADFVTKNNKPLKKSEIERGLSFLKEKIKENKDKRIVALGKTAQLALELSRSIVEDDIEYFTLPHPSPKNRLLNNKEYVEDILKECEKWLKY